MEELVVFGTAWCPAVAHLRSVLDAHGVTYRYHDIDTDKKAAKTVYRLQRGSRRVPPWFSPTAQCSSNPPTTNSPHSSPPPGTSPGEGRAGPS